MKAAVYSRYGPPEVIRIEEVGKPVPKDNEILVRVRATTVCAGDVRLRKADPFFLRCLNGLSRPKKTTILGMELAGMVESTGKSVTELEPGDAVFGSTGLKFGTYAEFVCVKDGRMLAKLPGNTTCAEAAALPYGGISALYFLRKAKISPGQEVLIYGASGSVGTFAVQLGRHFGARVTGVCGTANVELVKDLGADRVIDYTKEDFSKAGQAYDIIFDTVGKSGFWRSMKSLKRGGSYAFSASGLLAPTLGRIWAAITGSAKIIGGMAKVEAGDLAFLSALAERSIIRPVIDKSYPLEQIVEAHRYVEAGHKKGNVVIIIEPE